MIAASGVRSSWLICANSSLFTRAVVSVSAALRSSVRSRARSSDSSRRRRPVSCSIQPR